MKKPAFIIIILLAPIVIMLSSFGCTAAKPVLTLDEQAREINRSLMCPLCPGQTIDQSQSTLSAQMRSLVREKLEQGESREAILQFFVERYGEIVLAAPVKSGFNLIVWLVPVVGILAGGILLWVFIRRRVKGNGKTFSEMSSAAADDGSHDKYHQQLEKDLEAFDEKGFR